MCLSCRFVEQFPEFDAAREVAKELAEKYPLCKFCATRDEPAHKVCLRKRDEAQAYLRSLPPDTQSEVRRLSMVQLGFGNNTAAKRKFVASMQ